MKKTRREFLKKTGIASSTALLAPSILRPFSWAQQRKLGVALVGLGYYSTDLLAPALQLTENCELRGIVTGSPQKIPIWQEKYGIKDKNVYNYTNFDKLANNPDIDIIYVVLPPSMHAEYTIRGANAGKHIWCEKPMAPSVADCEAMIKACRDNRVKLSIGYRCQHDPNIQAYMKVAKEKPFGKVKMITSAAGYFDGRSNHWKQNKALGGGAMGDMGVYALQGARLATGEEPISVLAQASTTRPEIYHEVEETMMFQLDFPSGAKAACHTSFGIQMNYLQVNYENGWLKMEPHSSYGGNKGSMSNGTIINYPLRSQQAKQMDEDALAVLNNTAPIVPGEEGLRDIRVVEAIYKSAAENCAIKL
ncbi:Gfo/Idh/MocA family protein [Eudoraea chungangensis]|uniref:Gfo/Idh/MocA family protein n=1 Tax=Eudoraea chungangensis TaxID=1481905 RepID=UPI0023EA7E09|nr:Gfo/Idh/MocA family oxidoreductase [Eudoraea chungangensis]